MMHNAVSQVVRRGMRRPPMLQSWTRGYSNLRVGQAVHVVSPSACLNGEPLRTGMSGTVWRINERGDAALRISGLANPWVSHAHLSCLGPQKVLVEKGLGSSVTPRKYVKVADSRRKAEMAAKAAAAAKTSENAEGQACTVVRNNQGQSQLSNARLELEIADKSAVGDACRVAAALNSQDHVRKLAEAMHKVTAVASTEAKQTVTAAASAAIVSGTRNNSSAASACMKKPKIEVQSSKFKEELNAKWLADAAAAKARAKAYAAESAKGASIVERARMANRKKLANKKKKPAATAISWFQQFFG